MSINLNKESNFEKLMKFLKRLREVFMKKLLNLLNHNYIQHVIMALVMFSMIGFFIYGSMNGLITVSAMYSENDVYDVLQGQGYKNISLEGRCPNCCSEEDTFSTAFYADNINGVRIHGVVCKGSQKAFTVRFLK